MQPISVRTFNLAGAQYKLSVYVIFDLFRAIASSTARNCFNNSSRRVVFDDDDDDALAAVPPDGLSGIAAGERFFDVSTKLKIELN